MASSKSKQHTMTLPKQNAVQCVPYINTQVQGEKLGSVVLLVGIQKRTQKLYEGSLNFSLALTPSHSFRLLLIKDPKNPDTHLFDLNVFDFSLFSDKFKTIFCVLIYMYCARDHPGKRESPIIQPKMHRKRVKQSQKRRERG